MDEHVWALGRCDHDENNEDEERPAYLTKGSPPHLALRSIIMDKTWLKNAGEKCRNFIYDIDVEM